MASRRSRHTPLQGWHAATFAVIAAFAGAMASADSDATQDHPPTTTQPAPNRPAIFAALNEAPADLSMWARLRDGATLLERPSAQAFATGLTEAIAPKGPAQRFAEFAERLGLTPEETFRRYFGQDARLFVRAVAVAGAPSDWAILTRVERAEVDRLVDRMNPVVKPGGRLDLPAEHLALAYRDRWLVIAPEPSSPLLLDLADRFAAPIEPSLAADFAGIDTAGMLDGRLAIAYRGTGTLDGRTLLGLDIRGDRLEAGLRGRYAQPPLPDAQQAKLDLSILGAIGDEVLAVTIDPIRPRVTPDDAFIVASFPELVPPAAFRNNLGQQRYVFLGEVDGSTMQPPLRMRCPAIAVAYEVDDADEARDEQDQLMRAALRGLNRRALAGGVGEGKEPADPTVETADDGHRSVDIRGMLERFAGEHPLLRGCSLNWQVVRGTNRAWQVYATHPAWLAAVREELLKPTPPDAARCTTASAGKACGQRLAAHVRSWQGEAQAFAGDGAKGFANGVELLAGIAERFRSVSWRIGRPSEHTLDMQVEAELAAPESAGPRTVPQAP